MNDNLYGKVFLVGAGPGDPRLITVKGLECIKSADVIIYDYLANEKLLRYAKPDAELILATKEDKCHTDYDKICSLMLSKAKEGKIIVRLKGGDPFVFGRGGEEAEFLAEHNIPFEIVPGVTSAIAVPAYAGIPVTHRKYSSSVTLITGHKCHEKEKPYWTKNLRSETLIFYMALANLAFIQEQLLKEGKSKDTPVAAISWGTKFSQITITGTLENILIKVKEAKLTTPVIIVVGEVVKLREKIRWFDILPLYGKKIVVTRAQEQSPEFTELLEKEGAEVTEFPTIEIVPLKNYNELDDAIGNINKYNWLIFTSVNGVKFFFERIKYLKKDLRILSQLKICAVGQRTAHEIEERGLIVDYLPEEFKAEGIINGFLKMGAIQNLKILLPRAKKAREILPEKLRELGAFIDVIPVYETILPETNTDDILKKIKNNEIDLFTFASASSVTNFVEIFKNKKIDIIELLKSCKIASIGPITTETAHKIGLKVDIEPEKYTIPFLINAIRKFYENKEISA